VRAKLKRLHSPDIDDLESWSPGDEPFGFQVSALIGPADSKGEESFDMIVCTPEWFAREQMRGQAIRSGIHTLFVTRYDYRALWNFIERAAQRSEGNDWHEIGLKLAWLGNWEFADYTPRTSR
jgi:immunity protein 8 of polymorphic toxin system